MWSGLVNRVATAAKITSLACRRIVEAGARRAVGVGEVCMVQNIEEFGTELGGEAFLEFRFFDNGHIPVPVPQVAEAVTPRIADGSQRGRKEDRLAVGTHVAPNTVHHIELANVASNSVQTGGWRSLRVAGGGGNAGNAAAC